MKNILTRNFGLKLLSVLIAVLLWFVGVNINDPVDWAIFRGIKVDKRNMESVARNGRVVEVLGNSDSLDVTVWAKRSILDTLRTESIVATADMTGLSQEDTSVPINVQTTRYADRIERIEPSSTSMSIKVEKLAKKQVYVTANTTGEPAPGYIIGNVRTEQNLVGISGPQSLVDMIDRAEVIVDVTGLSNDIRTRSNVTLYDRDGAVLEDPNLVRNVDGIYVNVQLLATMSIPIEASVGGTPAEGYSVIGAPELSADHIWLAGPESELKRISALYITYDDLDVTGLSEDAAFTVDLSRILPTGIRVLDGEDHMVEVRVRIGRVPEEQLH